MPTIIDAIVNKGGGTGTVTVLDPAGDATQTTWAEIHHLARRMATVLASGELGAGRPIRRIGLLGETDVDLVCAVQAAWLTGAAITMLPQPNRDGHQTYLNGIRAIVDDAGLDAVVVGDTMPAVESGLVEPAALAVAFGDSTVVSLAEVAARAGAAAPAVAVRPDPTDIAVLQYTSGSTRAPRGVPVTHAHLAANIAAIKEQLDHEGTHPSVMLSWLPLYHDMGLVGFCVLPMSCGCPVVLQATAGFARRPASWLEAMTRYRATITGAPNFAYRLMTRLLAAGVACDLSSVRLMLSGAEPIEPSTMAAFATAGARVGLDPTTITPAYGLAESTLTVTHARVGVGVRVDRVDADALATRDRAVLAVAGRPSRSLVRLGHPVPGTRLRVVDRITGAPLGERVVGHIEVSGPSVVGHYWGEPSPPEGSWFRTGDLGYLTGPEPDYDPYGEPGIGVAGELVVCGRDKDVFFAAGRNVYPQDVEAAAAEVPGVRAGGTIAFAVSHDQGERLVLAVETREADLEPLRRAVAAAVLAESGLTPSDVAFLSPGLLPKTTSGKLRRAEARRRYLSGELGRTDEPRPRTRQKATS